MSDESPIEPAEQKAPQVTTKENPGAKVRKPRKLTYKQRAFIEEFMSSKNGTQSALKVYNTQDENTAGVIAFDNLRHPKIAEEIDLRFNEIQNKIKSASFKAMNRLEKLIDSEDEGIGIRASIDVMDRAGHKAIERTLTESRKISIDL